MSETEDVRKSLTTALTGPHTQPLQLLLESNHRFIIFSDQHKGAGDRADEFRLCLPAYTAALNYYRDRDYTLVLLGDVEELWEQGFTPVRQEYEQTLLLEGSFGAGRYYRVWGNHDDKWMSEEKVREELLPYAPTGVAYEGIRFQVFSQNTQVGTLLLLHGHQGTFDADKIRPLAKLFLRVIYRPWQRWTGKGKQTPSTDECLRGEHDKRMYDWAADQDRLILIAGHTHRPVWTSMTNLQKLEQELRDLETAPDAASHADAIAEKSAEVERRRDKYPPCNDTVKPLPAYFNSGCCKFEDGDITGIEIENGTIRLVKWHSNPNPGGPVVLEATPLAGLYSKLST